MIPASFDYMAVDSVDEALQILSDHGDEAKLLAGGMSLLPLMKLRLARPSVLVDGGGIGELSGVGDDGDTIVVGAMTRYSDLASSALLRAELPLLAHAAGQVGDPQVRHRGTLGGSLAHGDPAGDLPATILALDATLVCRGAAGMREIPADQFFVDFLQTALAPEEMLIEVRFHRPRGTSRGWSFQKFNRRASDWAVVGVAAARANGVTRVALVNMGPCPRRATAVENALAGGARVDDAAELAADGTQPPNDLNADAEYRRHLARVLVRRALVETSA